MNPLQLDNLVDQDSPVIVALDFPNAEKTMSFINQIDPKICKIKIGSELFTATGRGFIEHLIQQNFKVFLDLKYHDIPSTVERACQVAANMGVWMVNVHTSGGAKMMEAAANGLVNCSHKPLLVGVTLLTSMQESDLTTLGISAPMNEQILQLAALAQSSGLDGVVCSAQEVNLLKTRLGRAFITVTPGIRLTDVDIITDDQSRIMTPEKALVAGSDYLVLGRPITQAKDPLAIINDINLLRKKITSI